MTDTSVKIQHFAYDIIYYVLWIVEALLLLRFLFKILGVNPYNAMVMDLYALSMLFLTPFNGIFGTYATGQAVFEPSVLVAMTFYAIAAYVVVAFLRLITPSRTTSRNE